MGGRGVPISAAFFVRSVVLAFRTRSFRAFAARRCSVSLFARFRAADNSVRLARCPSLSEAAVPEALVRPDSAAWPRNSRRLYLPISRPIMSFSQVFDYIQYFGAIQVLNDRVASLSNQLLLIFRQQPLVSSRTGHRSSSLALELRGLKGFGAKQRLSREQDKRSKCRDLFWFGAEAACRGYRTLLIAKNAAVGVRHLYAGKRSVIRQPARRA